MPIQIRCTCQQILAVDEAHQGQVVGCPYCGTQLTVPVMQQQAPPAYAPPPAGFPPQPPQGYQPPSPPQGFPPQNPPGQPGWPNQFPGAGPSPSANNPFGGPVPDAGNPFAAPQASGFPMPGASSFPAPGAPSFPSAPGPGFSNNPTPSFPAPSAPGRANNAPSMPFLAMDVPAKSGSNLNDLTRGTPNASGGWQESAPEEARIWHIPCPNGHILDTPEDMLDQDVLCPYCETQFTLKKFQSVEETEKRERERALREERAGQLWLKWAIGIAAVVIVGVIALIAISASQ